ncbi:TorF family putative porin [Pseudoduganella rhizocola]|uniref:TorF family putative porin n=1 Tax=Pseudoduganella rhizocola TaxID=3382643 RepID=UPI0038B46C0E
MKHQMWPACGAVISLLLAGGSPAALAAQPSLSSNVTLASEYVSRGVRQSWGRPALQSGLDWTAPSGWFAGIWTSTVDKRFAEKAHGEIDLYGGYLRQLDTGSLSAALYYYRYPGGANLDYGELSLGANWRALYAKVNLSYTPRFFGIADARGSVYIDTGANLEAGEDWTINLHAGSGQLAGRGNAVWDWRDAKLGLARKLGSGWSTALAWTRAWGSSGAYAHYVSAQRGPDGRPLATDAGAGTFVLSVSRTY